MNPFTLLQRSNAGANTKDTGIRELCRFKIFLEHIGEQLKSLLPIALPSMASNQSSPSHLIPSSHTIKDQMSFLHITASSIHVQKSSTHINI
uniref:Pentatricopeptide repeat-containing protein At3g24000 n=1 Tax=Rhizophora mucronata TaxID=61149 RepID=A0A2P2IRB0_RHIMU